LARRRKGYHTNCDCEICQFSRSLSVEIDALEEIHGDVMARLKDGSIVLTPFFICEGMAVN
jgi:hypothetical protein